MRIFHCWSFQNVEVTDCLNLALLPLSSINILVAEPSFLDHSLPWFSLSMKVGFAWSSRLLEGLLWVHPRSVAFSIGGLEAAAVFDVVHRFVGEVSGAQMDGELASHFVGHQILAFGCDKDVRQTTHYIFIQAIIKGRELLKLCNKATKSDRLCW